jgi:hypothetical protein
MSGRGRGKRGPAKISETNTSDTPTNDEKILKKTSKKKQFPVVAVVGPDGIEGNLLPEVRRPLIVHLPIQSKDISMNDMPIMYDPAPPTDAQPYDIYADNPFYEGAEQIENKENILIIPNTHTNTNTNTNINNNIQMNQEHHQSSESTTTIIQPEPDVDYYNMKSTLLIQFKDSIEVKSVPYTSDAACFWCCHSFTNRPVVLPIRDTGEHLQVMGNFCSPECACAYLFDMRQDSHTRWEQLSLLYRVYGDACNGKIHPAPARNVLKHFGGNLSITEYRNLIRSHKVRIDIHLPPMVSILATMDTKPIDFYDASLTKGVTETVKERLQKAEEVLRLRRTKPLKAWESTLDACINLKIKT